MKCLTVLAATLALSLSTATAQGDNKKEKSPVKVEMEKLDEALDVVGDYLKEPKGDAPLKELAAAQTALVAAKQHAPSTAEKQPEEKRDAFVRAYKVEINKSIRLVLDLEDALLEKDMAAAGKAVEKLKELKKSSHRTYKPRRRRRRG